MVLAYIKSNNEDDMIALELLKNYDKFEKININNCLIKASFEYNKKLLLVFFLGIKLDIDKIDENGDYLIHFLVMLNF